MIHAPEEMALPVSGKRAPARVSREFLVASLGSRCSSWYTDSSDTDLQLHLDWSCGCRARKGGLVDRLWSYEPCAEHAEAVLPG